MKKNNNNNSVYFREGTSTEEVSSLEYTLAQETTSGEDSRIEVSKKKSTSTEPSNVGDYPFLDDKEYEIGKPKRIIIRGKIFFG
ncbi:MAG: hypothetical protein JW885_11545 [Deltaproteobacteria bacterium]|nr:hypothetical protein [Candidatus Zymogenaceae bacterium]